MATKPNTGVPGIPDAALAAIGDENTRMVLRALVDGWYVRNGASGNGDHQFVTKAELNVGVTKAVTQAVSGQAHGGASKSAGSVADLVNQVQALIVGSKLWSDLGSRIDLIQIDAAKNAADIIAESTKRLNADNAIVQSTNTQLAVINQNVAAVQTQTSTLANNVSAVAHTVTTLESKVGQNTSALQIEAQTRAAKDGDMEAKFTVKVDVNGYVSGFGLMSTANNSTPYSRFIVRADQFAIGSPSGPGIAPRVPFVVQTTSDANGNAPGVYMDEAFIKNASIDTLKVGGHAITVPMSGVAYPGSTHVAGSFGLMLASANYTLEPGSWVSITVTSVVSASGSANWRVGAYIYDGASGVGVTAFDLACSLSPGMASTPVFSGLVQVPFNASWCVAIWAGNNHTSGSVYCGQITLNAFGAKR